jgi:transposase
VRARRGGELTGPNPTDRGKKGTKYHLAILGNGTPVACVARAANVNDTMLFERLFGGAFAVLAGIRTVFADKGYDAESSRALCRGFQVEPCIHKRRQPHGSGLGKRRWPVERSNAWLLVTDVWPCAMTASASSSRPCSRPLASSWLHQAGWSGAGRRRSSGRRHRTPRSAGSRIHRGVR